MITTKRLLLRDLTHSDLDSLTTMFSSPDVMRFIGPRRPMSKAESADWLQHQMALQGQGTARRGVALQENDLLIGICGFQWINEEWDFGYYFRQEYWGNGYAQEACQAILKKKSSIIGNERFSVFIADNNLPSKALISKLGFVRKKKTTKSGEGGAYYFLPSPFPTKLQQDIILDK
ncbi:MAG: GNAT family N-acetyltransferase [Candidatus Electrothrix scaldis]|nr:MAG: GNAT family N-acetyltransferase [Candidatus Electrothrix sp. GW3-3]